MRNVKWEINLNKFLCVRFEFVGEVLKIAVQKEIVFHGSNFWLKEKIYIFILLNIELYIYIYIAFLVNTSLFFQNYKVHLKLFKGSFKQLSFKL